MDNRERDGPTDVKHNMEDVRLMVEELGNHAEWRREPVWLTPRWRDSQPEGERGEGTESIHSTHYNDMAHHI